MISWRALLGEAQSLEVVAANEEFVDGAVMSLRGAKLPLPPPHRFRYPNHVEQFASVRVSLERMAEDGDASAAVLRALLRKPIRAYAMRSGSSSYALVGAWRLDDGIRAAIATIDAAGPVAVVAHRQFGPAAHGELAVAMRDLYLLLDDASRTAPEPTRRSRDRVLWIGGSKAETGDPVWRDRIAAVVATEGFIADIQETPGRDPTATKKRISGFSGSGLAVWVPRLGSATLLSDIPDQTARPVLELSEFEFHQALVELELGLEAQPFKTDDDLNDDGSDEFDGDGPFYFKKIGTLGPGVDVMVHRRDPCRHDTWTRVHDTAPKARKGIERLTKRTVDRLDHCDRCTGYGFWRATLA